MNLRPSMLAVTMAALLPGVSASAREEPLVSLTAFVTASDPAKASAKDPMPALPSANKLGAPIVDEPGFAWPDAKQLAAVLDLQLDGYAGERKLSVHAALFEQRAPADTRRQSPLAKLEGEYELAAGRHRVAFPKLWRPAELCGERRFRVELEAALDGADEAAAVLHFTCLGPPPPTLKLSTFDISNPAQSTGQSPAWEPGERIQVNVIFEVRGNQAIRGPQLALSAVVDEDRPLMDVEMAERLAGLSWDARDLPAEDGVYQLNCRGSLPVYFAEPATSNHPFSIEFVIDSGAGQPLKASAMGRITDFYATGDRRNDKLEERLIRLDRARQWYLRRVGD